MQVEIQYGKIKQQSRIFIDGVEQRGILDFSVGMDGNIPYVILKVWAESMRVSLPNVVLIDQKIRLNSFSRRLRHRIQYNIHQTFCSTHRFLRWWKEEWKRARFLSMPGRE